MLYGGWADGSTIGDTQSRRHVLGLVGSHWGLGSDLLTNLFAPDADAGTRRALAQYQRESSSADTAVALLRLAYELDVREALPEVLAPTLVLHRGGDQAAPIAQGQALADGIPSATFVALDGRSHLPAFGDAQSVVRPVRRFLGLPCLRRAAPVGLTQRQMEVAALVADGLTNAEIGRRLHITERVRRVPSRARSHPTGFPLARPGGRLVRHAGALIPSSAVDLRLTESRRARTLGRTVHKPQEP